MKSARRGPGGDNAILAGLEAQLANAPATRRTAGARTWLSWARAAEGRRRKTYLDLVAARIAAGLDDRPEPRFDSGEAAPPKRPERPAQRRKPATRRSRLSDWYS